MLAPALQLLGWNIGCKWFAGASATSGPAHCHKCIPDPLGPDCIMMADFDALPLCDHGQHGWPLHLLLDQNMVGYDEGLVMHHAGGATDGP